MAVAGRAEERVGELEREHRRLVDDDEVVVVARAGRPRRAGSRPRTASSRARGGSSSRRARSGRACAARPCPSARTGGRACARGVAISTIARCVCVLPGAREAGEEDERARAHELDDGPLLVRDLHRRAVAARRRARPRRRRARSASVRREAPLHLPQLGAIDAVALDDDLRRRRRAHAPPTRAAPTSPTSSSFPARCHSSSSGEERVAVRLRLLEHEAQPGAQALRVVELDAERARDAVGGLEADARQLDQPVRVVREHVRRRRRRTRARAGAASPAAMPCAKRKRLDLADRRHLAPRRDRPLDALARDRAAGLRAHLAQPLRVAVELARRPASAPKCVDDRARERRARSRARAPSASARCPPATAAAPSGTTRPTNCQPVARVLGERAGADELLAGA